MKSFKEYLTESTQTYDYRIKLAGDISKDQIKAFEEALVKFDVIKMSEPKTTPVQEDPLDFPGLKNQEVSIFDITLNYPASADQLIEMAKSTGINPNNVKVINKQFADSWEANEGQPAEQAPLLEKDYDPQNKEQKEASEQYGDPSKYIKNADKSKFEIAGGKTPAAKTTNQLSMGTKSAMGSTKNVLPVVKSAAR